MVSTASINTPIDNAQSKQNFSQKCLRNVTNLPFLSLAVFQNERRLRI